MITIYKHINGISLNGKEWLLDSNNNILKFKTKQDALNHIGFVSETEAESNGIYLNKE
jgi:hypothetical protein